MRIFSKHADDDARAPGGLSQNDLTKLSPVPPPVGLGRSDNSGLADPVARNLAVAFVSSLKMS